MKKILLFCALLPSTILGQTFFYEIEKSIENLDGQIRQVELGPEWYRVRDIENAFISLPGDTVGVNFKNSLDSICVRFFCTGETEKLITCIKTGTSFTIHGETLAGKSVAVSELELRNLLAQFKNYLDGLKKPKKEKKKSDKADAYTMRTPFFI